MRGLSRGLIGGLAVTLTLGAQAHAADTLIGFNDALVGPHHLAGEAAAAGGDAIRFGAFDSAWTDRHVAEARAAGLRPIIGTAGTSPDPATCAAQTVAVAERYPDAVLEGWNEPNHQAYGDLAPEEAGRCYQAAASAIAPRKLLAPALAPNVESRRYLRRMLAVTGRKVPLAVHPYPNHANTSSYVEDVREQIRWLHRYRGRRQLWVTEIGVSSAHGFLGEQGQAETLRRIVRMLARKGVRVVVIHRLIDYPVNGWESGLGVLRTDGTRKPAFWALRESDPYRAAGPQAVAEPAAARALSIPGIVP